LALASVPRYTILIDAAVALKCFGVATGRYDMFELLAIFAIGD
jgi:hypothetical protein